VSGADGLSQRKQSHDSTATHSAEPIQLQFIEFQLQQLVVQQFLEQPKFQQRVFQ